MTKNPTNKSNRFIKIYPNYLPSGIGDYVDQNWNEIV